MVCPKFRILRRFDSRGSSATTRALMRQQASMMRDIVSGSRSSTRSGWPSIASNRRRSAMTPHLTTSARPAVNCRGGSVFR